MFAKFLFVVGYLRDIPVVAYGVHLDICTYVSESLPGVRTWMDCPLVTRYIRHVSWRHTATAAAIRCQMAPHRWACLARCPSWCLLIKWQCQTPSRAAQRQPEHRTSRRLIVDACRMLKIVCIRLRRMERHRWRHQDDLRRGRLAFRRRWLLRRYHCRMRGTPEYIIRVSPARHLATRWTWYFHSIRIRRRRNHPGHRSLRRSHCLRTWGFLNRWVYWTVTLLTCHTRNSVHNSRFLCV